MKIISAYNYTRKLDYFLMYIFTIIGGINGSKGIVFLSLFIFFLLFFSYFTYKRFGILNYNIKIKYLLLFGILSPFFCGLLAFIFTQIGIHSIGIIILSISWLCNFFSVLFITFGNIKELDLKEKKSIKKPIGKDFFLLLITLILFIPLLIYLWYNRNIYNSTNQLNTNNINEVDISDIDLSDVDLSDVKLD